MKTRLTLLALVALALTACGTKDACDVTSQFLIVDPEATENIVTNPSVEENTDGWNALGSATLSQTREEARFGSASLQVDTDGVLAGEGAYFRAVPSSGNEANTRHAASVYVRGEGRVQVRLKDGFNGNSVLSEEITLDDKRWIRVMDVIGGTGADESDDLQIHIETMDAQAVTFYVDGAQIEAKPYTTTYCDGDQPGCKWNVVENNSKSSRDSQTRKGGQFLPLDEEELGVYATEFSGVGMPPLRHNLQRRALLPGQEFQSTKTESRVFQILLWAKNEMLTAAERIGLKQAPLEVLHAKRQALIDIIKPDRVLPVQSFRLRYEGGPTPVEINARYDGGLDFEGDVRDGYRNSFPLRMLSDEDPYWEEDNQECAVLGYRKSLTDVMGLLRINDGEWERWGGEAATGQDNFNAVLRSPDGRIYVAGIFTSIGGETFNRVAYWDGESFNSLTNGLNDSVQAMAIDSQGRVYVGGVFTDEAGNPGSNLNRAARWDPDTETWNALGDGLNGDSLDIEIAPDGNVYVGGSFGDLEGGVGNTLNNIARWDPDNETWNSMGSGPGVDAKVNDIAIAEDGTIYLGGDFVRTFGTPLGTDDLLRIASYDLATDTLSGVGGGMNNGVGSLVTTDDGLLYATGGFTMAGSVSAEKIAVFNGAAWSALGDGLQNGNGNFLAQYRGLVFVSGGFDQAGDLDQIDNVAAWNGSAYVRVPIEIPSGSGLSTAILGIVENRDDLYMVGDFGSVADDFTQAFAAETTVVNNAGSSEAFPVIEIDGPGTVSWLENYTTGKRIYLDYTLEQGERLTVDFRPGSRGVRSSWRGNVLDAVLPYSDFSSFSLVPGENKILLFVLNDGADTAARLRYVPRHWSADAAGVAR